LLNVMFGSKEERKGKGAIRRLPTGQNFERLAVPTWDVSDGGNEMKGR